MASLTVVIGSTRPGRAGLPIGQWFVGRARNHGRFEVRVVDLAELDLPMLDEPNHPRLRQYTHQHTKDWSAVVDASDAFVFVVPEYNYGMTAPVKNAIDYLHHEWQYKPVGFVSYVNIPFHTQFIDDSGQVQANETMEHAADAMLDALVRTQSALRSLRAPAHTSEG